MKCKKCNQQNLENTKYCIKCGEELMKTRKIDNTKLFIIVASFLIIGTILISLFIMFYNTDKELEKYKKDEIENKEEIKEEELIKEETNDFLTNYYSGYKIIDNNKVLNNYILDFYKDFVKTKVHDTYIMLKNPKFYIKDNKQIVNQFKILNENCIYLLVEDKNSKIYFQDYVEFVINDNNIYLYDNNELFKLEKIKDKYKKNISFYSLNYIEKKYGKEVNDEITKIENKIDDLVNSNETIIAEFNYEIIKQDKVTHISYEMLVGYPHSGANINKKTISFFTNTLKYLNLKQYLETREIDYLEFKEYFDAKWKEDKNRTSSFVLEETSDYYYEKEKLIFSSQIEYEADLIIDLKNFRIEE